MMRYGAQWTDPLTPRLPTVSLPAESPRPASSYTLPTSTFTSYRQLPTAPAPVFGRTYEDPRPISRSYSTSSRHSGSSSFFMSVLLGHTEPGKHQEPTISQRNMRAGGEYLRGPTQARQRTDLQLREPDP
ncbi:hypothetical protein B0H19DRAFT_1110159 [Mycena capillaripes]|nr:hypothetical protein B0H19DRAFT_1110159 [Mycena capillaripes]